MIDLTIHEEALERAIGRARERNIIIPTFAQQRNPALIPDAVKRGPVSYTHLDVYKRQLRYCVPISLPWRLGVVGSWISKKISSTSCSVMRSASKLTRTTSAWPVGPLQTCS